MAQAVKTFVGVDTVMQKINLILKGFSEVFNEPMTVISVTCSVKILLLVFNGLKSKAQSQVENQLKLYLLILKSYFQLLKKGVFRVMKLGKLLLNLDKT